MKPLKPNDLGKKYLVEQCKNINISKYLKETKGKLKELTINSDIEADGFRIELITSNTNYKGLRFWFKCPLCNKRAGKLYKHPISQKLGCRGCLNLEYRSRRYKGMVESSYKEN